MLIVTFALHMSAFLCIIALWPTPVAAGSRDCTDVDIRNTVAEFEKIRHCTVIYGHLQIVLVSINKTKNFTGLTFPKLREITGYLLVYHVDGLLDLGGLFPNLVVIRGASLFADHSFMIYDMAHLERVGLKNLIAIERGHVRIQNCPNLCFASSIDWSLIMTSGSNSDNWITKDRAVCPDPVKKCLYCPMNGKCWSEHNCQKKIGDSFTKNIFGNCHHQCLGKCVNNTASGCYVCKNVSENGTCVEECSSKSILNQITNRCLTEEQCKKKSLYVHEQFCVQECPKNFMVDPQSKHCVRCPEKCPKRCPGGFVEYLSTAQALRGCTIIEGNLMININSDVQFLEKELQFHMGDIEEIQGFFKIFRSNSLTSLNFMTSLKFIRGQTLYNDHYSLIVSDNENLKRLFDFTNRDNLYLGNGSLFIHQNTKLCRSEIDKFIHHTNVASDPINSIQKSFMAHCDYELILSNYEIVDPSSVTIYWKKFHPPIDNPVKGYTIHYIETTKTNLTWLFGRETCSKYSWKQFTVEDGNDENLGYDHVKDMHFCTLKNLKQVTQYAFYVRSYQENPHSTSGQSVVKYFTTPLHLLTQPLVSTLRKNESSITLFWKSAPDEEKFIKFYYVDVLYLPDKREILDQRNYCIHPIVNEEESVPKRTTQDYRRDCQCDKESEEDKELENLVLGETTISCADEPDHEICALYGNKQFEHSFQQDFERLFMPKEKMKIEGRDMHQIENFLTSYKIEKKERTFTIPDLLPFSNYAFQFFACHNPLDCSGFYYHSDRTGPNVTTDNLSDDELKVRVNGKQVILQFKEPKQPNGITVGFKIEYQVTHVETDKDEDKDRMLIPSTIACIARLVHEQNNYSHVVSNLRETTYSFRVKTLSIAMESQWTEWKIVNLKTENMTTAMKASITFAIFALIALAVGVAIFSYRRFSCFRKGDDLIYLMSDLEEELDDGEEKRTNVIISTENEPDFHPVDFSRNLRAIP